MRKLIVWTVLAAGALLAASCGGGGDDTGYPPAGEDRFENTTATVQIELTQEGVSVAPVRLQQLETITLEGPALVMRGDPQEADDGAVFVSTEIVEMTLTGTSPTLGPVIVRESADRQSLGEVRQQTPGEDFPADSFFYIFVEVELTDVGLTLHNEEPMHMEAELTGLPPAEGDTYRGEDDRPLYTPAGLRVGRIVDALHVPEPPAEPEATEEPEATDTPETADATNTPAAVEPTDTPAGPASRTLALSCDHRIPGEESDVIARVEGLAPGETVSGNVTGPGVLGDGSFTATANAEGVAEARVPINQFGTYQVTADGLSDSIEVGDVCPPDDEFAPVTIPPLEVGP